MSARGLEQPAANLCIIPARGGSKRIPKKNILPVAGKPLICYSIEVAQKSELFQKILVSTDDPEIERVAREAGAAVHLRPPDLATDRVRLTQVCLYLLQQEAQAGKIFSKFCLLQPTSPLRTPDDLQASYRLLEPGINYVISISEFDDPPFWALHEKDDGYLSLYFGSKFLVPRFELPAIYRHNGSIIWARTAAFLEEKEFLTGKLAVGYHMPLEKSIEADYPHQLKLIELLLTEPSS